MASDRAGRGRRLLVLGAGPAQLGLLRAARRRGLFVVACDRDPQACGFVYADRPALVSSEDEQALERLARAERVEGIVSPGSDWPVAIAARLAARLGLPHPLAPEVAALAVSKLRQRARLARAGVSQPRWQLLGSAAEEVQIETPCVVKPPDRQGQRGLRIANHKHELPAAVEVAIAASRSASCLVEELIDGPELTVNAFSVAGRFHALTATDRPTADPPAFGVALAHVWPSGQVAAAVAAAVATAQAAADALGVRDGPSYTQLRLASQGPRVIELAARLGGGHDAELCQAALGIDLNELALAAALGEPVELPGLSPAGGACVQFLVPPEGELAAVRGLERAAAAPGVVDAAVYRRPGWRFGPLRRGGDRAGFVLASGASRQDALERAQSAAALIELEVVPRPGGAAVRG